MIDWGKVTDIGVIGLGQTGSSVIEYLTGMNRNVIAIDEALDPPCLEEIRINYPGVEIILGELHERHVEFLDMLVISPGVDPRHPVLIDWQKQGGLIVGDVELFCQAIDTPVIAVTGSNGKSTLVTMIGEALTHSGKKVEVAGNIGVPVLSILKKPAPEFYILELSSFQLETIDSLSNHVAVVANYSPDHLDRYCDFTEYVKTKNRVYNGASVAIINQDQLDCVGPIAAENSLTFSLENKADFSLVRSAASPAIHFQDEWLCCGSEMYLQGRHYWQNALILFAVMQAVKASFDSAISVLKCFKGLPHRCQLVRKKNEVSWYNDSKATNEAAVIAAIQTLRSSSDGGIILIMGGDAKGAVLEDLQSVVSRDNDHVLIYGKDRSVLFDVFSSVVNVKEVEDLNEAVLAADQLAKKGDIVLLSPACSSLDMFMNYQHRGDVFVQYVEGLEG